MQTKDKSIEQIWHCDDHELLLRINRSDLEILSVLCPHETGGQCKNRNSECVVSAHVLRYGMDCNSGVCLAHSNMKICWTLIGDIDDMDSSQLWFFPIEDEVFQAWMVANVSPETEN